MLGPILGPEFAQTGQNVRSQSHKSADWSGKFCFSDNAQIKEHRALSWWPVQSNKFSMPVFSKSWQKFNAKRVHALVQTLCKSGPKCSNKSICPIFMAVDVYQHCILAYIS